MNAIQVFEGDGVEPQQDGLSKWTFGASWHRRENPPERFEWFGHSHEAIHLLCQAVRLATKNEKIVEDTRKHFTAIVSDFANGAAPDQTMHLFDYRVDQHFIVTLCVQKLP